MKLLLAVVLFSLADAKSIGDPLSSCKGVFVKNQYYDKLLLKNDIDKPYQLAMDYDKMVLYFSYTSFDGFKTAFKSAFYNLNTDEFGTIQGVPGPFANAVDPRTNEVYIGGSDGIYLLEDGNIATKQDITKENIWQIFIKDGIYFTTYPKEEAFVYKNGETKKVEEIGNAKAMLLALDRSSNIYYYNSTGLFKYNRDGGKTTNLGVHVVNAFTTDKDGKLYFSTPSAIFSLDSGVEKIARITNIYGMAVTLDGSIIYAEDESLIQLVPSDKDECNLELPYMI